MRGFERLSRREFFGVKLGLDNVRALTEALGHPERACRAVIVAGTNGKGSVAAFTSRALHAAGHRVGLYTSPHLIDLTERYRVSEVTVGAAALEEALDLVIDTDEALCREGRMASPATYFELTTVAAFVLFRTAAVDVAVLEVGMGGRFDATNVAEAPFAAITSIALDHTRHLGTTLTAIAGEKAGVISPGARVVSGVREPEAADVVRREARAQRATLVEAVEDTSATVQMQGYTTWLTLKSPQRTYGPLPLALNGRHQVDNAAVAVRLLETLDAHGFAVSGAAIETGLREAWWPARLQVIERTSGPPLVIDGAHNPAGSEALGRWIREAGLAPCTLVLAVMRDKDVQGMLQALLSVAARVIATTVHPPRGLEATSLADEVRRLRPTLPVGLADTPRDALRQAGRIDAPVVVAGSLFLAGAVLSLLRETTEAP